MKTGVGGFVLINSTRLFIKIPVPRPLVRTREWDCGWSQRSSPGDSEVHQLSRAPITASAFATSVSKPEFVLPEALGSRLWQWTSLPMVLPTWSWRGLDPAISTVPWVRSAHVDPSCLILLVCVGGFWEASRKGGGSLSLVPSQALSGLGKPSPALTWQNFHISNMWTCVRSLNGVAPLWRNAQG